MKDDIFFEETNEEDGADAFDSNYESRVIKQLLKTLSEKPLLTREKEVALAQQIEQGKMEVIGVLAENIEWGEILPHIQERINSHTTKTRKSDREIISALNDFWQKEGKEEKILKVPLNFLEMISTEKGIPQAIAKCQTTRQAFDVMVQSNMLLVVYMAKKRWRKGSFLSFYDFMQEGNIGLMKAVEKFNWRKGCRFATLATWWIDQAMKRLVEDESRTIRIPAYRQKLAHQESLPSQPLSLEQPFWDESGESLLIKETLADKGPSVEEETEKNEQREVINQALSHLPSKQAEVIKLRFGLGNTQPCTLEKIAKRKKVSKERIRQIEKEALANLRRPRLNQKLKELL